MGFAVDVSDGAVYQLPVGGEDDLQLKLQYAADSTLLRARWFDQDAQDVRTCVREDFLWSGSSFVSQGRQTGPAYCRPDPS